MSRVHDALRRAEKSGEPHEESVRRQHLARTAVEAANAAAEAEALAPAPPVAAAGAAVRRPNPARAAVEAANAAAEAEALASARQDVPPQAAPSFRTAPIVRERASATAVLDAETNVQEILSRVKEFPFTPAPDTHMIDASRPHEPPAEEFRTLRTRLNHLQGNQRLHTVVVTSPSPSEGKSFAAANLALAEAQLDGNATLLVDCDFRRPIVHSLFQVDRSPGMTDYLQGKAELADCIKKIAGSNLYILPAGGAVINPLELLNLREVKALLDELPNYFNWVILDSPPLLFAADANLLSTLSDGTILVVRIGNTTIDSVTRAMQSLCQNNVLGTIVNGARRGELYSKYTYYHSYYSETGEEGKPAPSE